MFSAATVLEAGGAIAAPANAIRSVKTDRGSMNVSAGETVTAKGDIPNQEERMGELVDAIVRVVEFMVQGALALALVGYVLAWFHRIKEWVYEHADNLTFFLFGPQWKRRVAEPPHLYTPIALGLGALYLVGIVTNGVGYWLLAPAHDMVIEAAVPRIESQHPSQVSASVLVQVVIDRVTGGLLFHKSVPQHDSYEVYIEEEAKWRNSNLEAVKHTLDPLLKQDRVIRGSAVIALGFLVVTTLKTLSFLLSLLVLLVPWHDRAKNPGVWLYDHFVNPADVERNTRARKSSTEGDNCSDVAALKAKRKTTFEYVVANTTYAVVAYLALWCSLGAYATLEKEYHLLAHFGARSNVTTSATTSTAASTTTPITTTTTGTTVTTTSVTTPK